MNDINMYLYICSKCDVNLSHVFICLSCHIHLPPSLLYFTIFTLKWHSTFYSENFLFCVTGKINWWENTESDCVKLHGPSGFNVNINSFSDFSCPIINKISIYIDKWIKHWLSRWSKTLAYVFFYLYLSIYAKNVEKGWMLFQCHEFEYILSINSPSFICHPHFPPTFSLVPKMADDGGKTVYSLMDLSAQACILSSLNLRISI